MKTCPECKQELRTAVLAEDANRCHRCGQVLTLTAESAESGRSYATEHWAGDHMVSTPAQALVRMGMQTQTIRQEDEAALAHIGLPVGRYGGETAGGLPIPAD